MLEIKQVVQITSQLLSTSRTSQSRHSTKQGYYIFIEKMTIYNSILIRIVQIPNSVTIYKEWKYVGFLICKW